MENIIDFQSKEANDLKGSVLTVLPMLRAVSGGYTSVSFTDSDKSGCADICLNAEEISANRVRDSFLNLPADSSRFTVFIKGIGCGAVISVSRVSYEDAENPEQPCSSPCGGGRARGKVAIVTGAAQGFGAGIADSLAREGAHVVIADLNGDGAERTAADLREKYGKHAAFSVTANVSDEDSVRNMVESAVLRFGGLDILVNNAGIVRAGSLAEMQKKDFELVTSVNYTAYFLCAKYAVIPMKAAREICPDRMADIIEINSKSGLAGSNKNFAYAGSKFGGIGLTQSFALELAEYGIKVNAVCPGNFLDGPLWSDPEKGLFVQYLRAGKVKGAKTVDDVRRHYESKVPLGRGCRTEDVVRAILYIIEQQYETGQAIPVTGGQEMLN